MTDNKYYIKTHKQVSQKYASKFIKLKNAPVFSLHSLLCFNCNLFFLPENYLKKTEINRYPLVEFEFDLELQMLILESSGFLMSPFE